MITMLEMEVRVLLMASAVGTAWLGKGQMGRHAKALTTYILNEQRKQGVVGWVW